MVEGEVVVPNTRTTVSLYILVVNLPIKESPVSWRKPSPASSDVPKSSNNCSFSFRC